MHNSKKQKNYKIVFNEMHNIERIHYESLRKNFNSLIDLILGVNYYTMSTNIYDSDIESFYDMTRKINKMKRDLKIYKTLFYLMIIVTIILVILIIKQYII